MRPREWGGLGGRRAHVKFLWWKGEQGGQGRKDAQCAQIQNAGEHGTGRGWDRSGQAMHGSARPIHDFCLYPKISQRSLNDFNYGEGLGEEPITFVYEKYLKWFVRPFFSLKF